MRRNEACILVVFNGGQHPVVVETHPVTTTFSPHKKQIKFFLDPLKVLNHYKSCDLHPLQTKCESLRQEVLYHFVTGNELKGVHNSENDIRAQTTIIRDTRSLPFLNWSASVHQIIDIFTKTEWAAMLRKMEPLWPVHVPWQEQLPESNNDWEPSPEDTYGGVYGGGVCRPSNAIWNVVQKNKSLVDIILFLFPIFLFQYIAN